MFGKLGKQYAAQVAEKIEQLALDKLNERNPQPVHSEKTTERLHKVSGRRKAVFIGINYNPYFAHASIIRRLLCRI